MRAYLFLVLFLALWILAPGIYAGEANSPALREKEIRQDGAASAGEETFPRGGRIRTDFDRLLEQYDLNRDGVIDFEEAEKLDERNEVR